MSGTADAAPGDAAGTDAGRQGVVAPRAPERRRIVVVGVVAALLVLAGVANADFRPRATARAARADVAIAPRVLDVPASSSAWYCAGPLPIGTAGEASSIAVTNLGSRRVAGQVVVASSAGGRSTTTRVSVPAGTESVVGLTRRGARASAAATVLVDGSGIAVEEIVHGDHGLAEAPCADKPGPVAYFATGSTLGANDLSLGIFDPGATPAVVDVTLDTSSGTVQPPAFQGLTVGAGQLQVLDIGHEVPSRAIVAAAVSATGGAVVAGTAVTAVVNGVVMSSLVQGEPAAASTWLFSGGPSGVGTTSAFDVFDPGSRPARVDLRLVTPTGSSELSSPVPAHGVVQLSPATEDVPGAMRWAVIESTGAPVVVGRESVVEKAVVSRGAQLAAAATKAADRSVAERLAAARQRQHERQVVEARRAAAARHAVRGVAHHPSTPTSTTTTTTSTPTTTTNVPTGRTLVVPYLEVSALPEILPGLAVTSGVATASRTWVLPGGESDPNTSEVVVVSNPSRRTAHVRIVELTGDGPAPYGGSTLASLPRLTVAPGATLTVDMSKVVGDVAVLPLATVSDVPVLVGELAYGRKPNSGFSLASAVAASQSRH